MKREAALFPAIVAFAQQHEAQNVVTYPHSKYAAAHDKMSMKVILRVCSVAVLFLLPVAALGPATWVPRSSFGWQFDHFVGYFAITLTFCFAWPRPRAVGATIIALALVLEGLQAFTPDRHADMYAALISASGAMAAAILPADLFVEAPKRLKWLSLLTLARMRALTASRRSAAVQSPALAGLVSQQLQSS